MANQEMVLTICSTKSKHSKYNRDKGSYT